MQVSTSNNENIEYEPNFPCPECQGEKVWDNRENKLNPKGPDFKCANKENCGLAMWIIDKPKDKPKAKSATLKGLDVPLPPKEKYSIEEATFKLLTEIKDLLITIKDNGIM